MKSIILLLTTALALFALTASVSAKPKIAVLGLEVINNGGVDKTTTQAAQDFAQKLRNQASKSTSKYSLAPNSAQDLLELKLLSGCSDEGRTCMSDIGKELGADRLLYGKLERRKRGYQISLKLLNTKTRQMEKTITELIPSSDLESASMTKWAGVLYGRLIGLKESGSLVVNANVDQATVSVDGVVKTTLVDGQAKINGLKEGVHSITIEADGYDTYQAQVVIDAGESEDLSVGLAESKIYQKPIKRKGNKGSSGSGWKIAFVGGVLVTSGMAAGFAFNGLKVVGELKDNKEQAFQDLEATIGSTAASQFAVGDSCGVAKSRQNTLGDGTANANLDALISACNEGDDAATLTNIFIAGTAVAALATVYFGYKGWVLNDGESEERMGRKKTKKNRVVVTPQLTPESVGAGLSIDF